MTAADSPTTDADAIAAMRVVRGNPTDDEVVAAHAVITALLAEQHAAGAQPVAPPVDLWRRGARSMRAPLTPGAGAWAASRGMRGC